MHNPECQSCKDLGPDLFFCQKGHYSYSASSPALDFLFSTWFTALLVCALYAFLIIIPDASAIRVFIYLVLLKGTWCASGNRAGATLWSILLLGVGWLVVAVFPAFDDYWAATALALASTIVILYLLPERHHKWTAASVLGLASLWAFELRNGTKGEGDVLSAISHVTDSITSLSMHQMSASLLAIGSWRWCQFAILAILGGKMISNLADGSILLHSLWKWSPDRPHIELHFDFPTPLHNVPVLGFILGVIAPIAKLVAILVNPFLKLLIWAGYWLVRIVEVFLRILFSAAWYLIRVAAAATIAAFIEVIVGCELAIYALATASLFVLTPMLMSVLNAIIVRNTSEAAATQLKGGPLFLAVAWLIATVCSSFLWMLVVRWSARRFSATWNTAGRGRLDLDQVLFNGDAGMLLSSCYRVAGNFIDGYAIKRLFPYCLIAVLLCDAVNWMFGIGPFRFGLPAEFLLASSLVIVLAAAIRWAVRAGPES